MVRENHVRIRNGIQYFRGVGFSDRDIGRVMIRHPQLLTVDVEKAITPKIE